jgi:hypothetical protein
MAKKKDYKAIENDNEAFEKHRFNYVKNALRIATYKWPYFHMAMSRQRLERGLYQCESCKGSFGPKEINRDHVEPVIAVTGWVNWEEYIKRLFVKSEGIQILCIACHENKTATENIMRVKNGQKAIKVKKKLTVKKKRVRISK